MTPAIEAMNISYFSVNSITNIGLGRERRAFRRLRYRLRRRLQASTSQTTSRNIIKLTPSSLQKLHEEGQLTNVTMTICRSLDELFPDLGKQTK